MLRLIKEFKNFAVKGNMVDMTLGIIMGTAFQAKAEDSKDSEVETPKNIELLMNIEKLLEEQNRLLKNSK
jgi:large-conductance mechanosensitive channel